METGGERAGCLPVSEDDLRDAIARSRSGSRGRQNLNIHSLHSDPIQRMFNVFQPGSYVRPHRHSEERWELFLVLSGRAGVLLFDGAGAVLGRFSLAPGQCRALEITGGVWHTLLALEPDTVLFEVKPGPYVALEDKDFAPWAPAEGDAATEALLSDWSRLFQDCGESRSTISS